LSAAASPDVLDLPVVEIRVGGDDLPWRLTFEFLEDVYSVLRQTWLQEVASIEAYQFVLTGLDEGSKRFKGQLRPRWRRESPAPSARVDVNVTQSVEFPAAQAAPPARRRITPGEALTAGAVVLGSVLTPLVGGLVAKAPDMVTPTVAPVPIASDRIERMERFVRLHGRDVSIEVIQPDGSRILVQLGDIDVEFSSREDTLEVLELHGASEPSRRINPGLRGQGR
jgi:hypothetical protein